MSFFEDQIKSAKVPKAKVLAIGGSPRKGGNSDILLKHIIQGVSENKITVDSHHL